MTFDFYGQHLGLTYSQVGSRTVETFVNFFRSLGHPLAKFIVGVENHQDGGIHFHVYAIFNTRFRTRNIRFWDFDNVHPNIKKVDGRRPKAWYDYVTKEGQTTVWPQGAEFTFKNANESKYGPILAAANAEEALKVAQAIMPRDYIMGLERLQYFVKQHFKPQVPEFVSDYDPDQFRVHQTMEQWVRDNLGYVFLPFFFLF